MNKNEIKYKYKSYIYNIEKNKIKNDTINLMNFFIKMFKKIEYFKIKKSKALLLIEMLLLVIKINLISSQSKKRYIMSQSSSIKLKIENSGNQKIYSNGIYEWCNPVVIPDEIYINEEKQIEMKSEYYF